ncbi:MAG TPA: chemotaxis protein CheW [bacterium]|nr:chemotaxis protein CheW [bacterium]
MTQTNSEISSYPEALPLGENEREIKLVVFLLAGVEFGLPIGQVREIIRVAEITRMPKAPRFLAGILNLRGRIVSVLDFKKRFELPDCDLTSDARIIMVEVGGQIVGLLVDKVLEVQKIPESKRSAPAGPLLTIRPEFLSGVAEAKNGLILLLDLDRVFNLDEIKSLADSEWSASTEERLNAR